VSLVTIPSISQLLLLIGKAEFAISQLVGLSFVAPMLIHFALNDDLLKPGLSSFSPVAERNHPIIEVKRYFPDIAITSFGDNQFRFVLLDRFIVF
jgi:hypothetical protein